MDQKLAVIEIKKVAEVEPAIFEIVAVLEDRTTARLRMNAFTLQHLGNLLRAAAAG